MTGRNHQGLELEHPNIFTFEPRKGKNTYKINIKKMKQRERIVQRIELSNQYSSQQKILKIRKRTKQSNKKNTFQKSNYQKRLYGFSH
jgi:ribosomal protein L14E/L6E/L27E